MTGTRLKDQEYATTLSSIDILEAKAVHMAHIITRSLHQRSSPALQSSPDFLPFVLLYFLVLIRERIR